MGRASRYRYFALLWRETPRPVSVADVCGFRNPDPLRFRCNSGKRSKFVTVEIPEDLSPRVSRQDCLSLMLAPAGEVVSWAVTRQVAAPRTCQELYYMTLPTPIFLLSLSVSNNVPFLTCRPYFVSWCSSTGGLFVFDPAKTMPVNVKGQRSDCQSTCYSVITMHHTPKRPHISRVVQQLAGVYMNSMTPKCQQSACILSLDPQYHVCDFAAPPQDLSCGPQGLTQNFWWATRERFFTFWLRIVHFGVVWLRYIVR